MVTFVVYAQAGSWEFVNLDDDAYVQFQPMVNQGLRLASIQWAWTYPHSNNWHPVTSLSHMFDCTLFGVNPGPMHWENVGWHWANAILVFLIWRLATKSIWRAAAVAGLFALHPMHVESVAWISERKDVLSTFFWLLALGAYVRYTQSPSVRRYLLVAVLFMLALLSKPMVVSLPLTLLLFDFWPLNRWRVLGWRRVVAEKTPLFALALLHSGITLLVQSTTGATHYGERFPLAARMGNAVVSLVRYMGKGIWPQSLAPHYDHPGWWPWWSVIGSASIVFFLCAIAWRQREQRPWLLFGWAWFLITLLPVLGIVQVGAQAMADRYTYVSSLGLFTVAAWALGEWAARHSRVRPLLATSTALVLGFYAVIAQRQASAWQNSLSLYQRSIAAGTDNATLHYLLGTALQAAGHSEAEVADQFHQAVRCDVTYTNAYTQLALLALRQGNIGEAEKLVEKTVELEPRNAALRRSLGVLRNIQGRPAEATEEFAEALRLDPGAPETHHELAWMYRKGRRGEAALHELEIVVRNSPWDYDSICELGDWYLQAGRRKEARQCFERGYWINPQCIEAQQQLRRL